MRCYSCERLSFLAICKECQDKFLSPTLQKKWINQNLFVYYFYDYDDIKDLIKTKYKVYGSRIFNILANNSFRAFSEEFAKNLHANTSAKILVLPIDDNIRENYSHSAILARATKTNILEPTYAKLQAQNYVKYAGKSREFRKANKRDFKYTGRQKADVILVDDLVTTGLTMRQAKSELLKHKCKVLFGVTLSCAK